MAVLVSGGLDSAVLLGELARKRRVQPVYVSQGLAWEDGELYWLRQFLSAIQSPRIKPLKLLLLPMRDLYGDHWSTGKKPVPGSGTPDSAVYLPGRNPALIMKVAIFCALNRIPVIALASLGHNPFPDATPGFFRAYSRALSMALGRPIRIETPYRRLTKAEVIRIGKHLPLELTFSCLAPVGTQHCGRCNKCAERKKAFRKANVEDKTIYSFSRAEHGRRSG